jgi:hypothetical protein
VKKIVLLIIVFLNCIAFAADSTLVDTSYNHIRKRAAILSIVIPGAGQFYNEIGHRKVQGRKNISWWRAPLFWAGLGATGYFAVLNGKEAFQLKNEWLYRKDNNGIGLYYKYKDISDPNDLIYGNLTQTFGFLKHAKWRDYNIAGFVLIYGLNILDAYVDAHFVTFDVSQNLTLSFQPKMYSLQNYGIGLHLKFNYTN